MLISFTNNPDYVCRVTADEGDIGKRPLGPISGCGTPDARHPDHVADAHHRRGCTHRQEYRSGPRHQLHDGIQADHRRGTRVRDDFGKLFFNILDYTGSATRLFADPDFDGDPIDITDMILMAEMSRRFA